jgi:hypothetical protein
MKFQRWQERAALFLLVLYCLDLTWKVADWKELSRGLPWWGIALGLAVRFLVMGFILFMYLRLKKAPQEPVPVTKTMRTASLRSMRVIHAILFVAIVGYVFLAERSPRTASDPSTQLVASLSILAALMVVALSLRRKFLPRAIEKLKDNAADETVLGRWRMANILSMVLTMTVALFGFALRMVGASREVAWPFFIASIILMLLRAPFYNALIKH